jgi:acetyl esterase/lipase
MRVVLIIGIVLFISLESHAQQRDTLYLWPGEVPGAIEAKHPPVQTSDTSRGVTRFTDITNPAIEIMLPDEELRNGASVIISPGGGYSYLAINIEGYEIGRWLNELGFTAFVLQYRAPDQMEKALYDVQRAIRMVRSRSSEWGVDPQKVGVMGFSAGGHLSAAAGTRFSETTYAKQDRIDELSARPDFALLIYPAYLDGGENGNITPELTVSDDTPPMFLFATVDDPYASSSTLVMAEELMKNDIPYELHILPEGGHGYGLRKGNTAAETWPELARSWLERVVSGNEEN